MASFSQYYSDYMSTNEFSELPIDHPMTSTDGSSSSASAMHIAELTLPFSDINNGAVSSMVPFDSSDMVSCSSSSSSMPSSMAALWLPAAERLGASDTTVPTTLMPINYDTSSGLFAISRNIEAGNYCHQHDQAYELGDQECSVLASNFWPLYPAITSDNWEIQAGIAQRIEEPTLKVARYSAEERKDRILRYLKKRSQRNFNKTIKYACRKTLADKRVRVRGRFAKNNEFCDDDQTLAVKTMDHNLQEAEPCYYDPDHMKPQDEEWLQEAIANLMYYRLLPDNILELPDKYLN